MTTARVELSGDGWAQLRDPETLTNGQRKPFLKMFSTLPMKKLPNGTEQPDVEGLDVGTVLELGDTLIRVFVEAWSYGPLPSEDEDALDNLLASDYDTLQEACGKLLTDLVPKSPAADPTAPSTP